MNVWRRALLATVCGVAVAGVYAAQPVLVEMGGDLGIAPQLTGWIVATGQIGYLVGLVLLVPLGDVVARRPRLIAAHLVATAAGLAVTALASGAWTAFGGLAVAGFSAVVVQTTVAYAASTARPDERGRTIGVVTSGVVVGILGSRVVTGVLAELWGWRSVYAVLAVLSVGLAAVVVAALPPEERTDRVAGYRQALVALGGLFGRRLFVTRGLIAFFLFASFGTLWSGLSLPLSGSPWFLDESRIGLFGLVGLAGALAAARAGRWADAGRAGPATGIALALLVVSWVATAQLPWTLWVPLLGIVVLDAAVQAVHVGNQHLLTAATPDRVSGVVGGYMIFYSLGSALGAASTTAVYATAGWAGCSVLGAAFAACGLVVWAADRVTGRGRAAAASPGPGSSRWSWRPGSAAGDGT